MEKQLTIGSPVTDRNGRRRGKIVDIVLSPNGEDDLRLVTLVFVRAEDGSIWSETATDVTAEKNGNYPSFDEAEHLARLKLGRNVYNGLKLRKNAVRGRTAYPSAN